MGIQRTLNAKRVKSGKMRMARLHPIEPSGWGVAKSKKFQSRVDYVERIIVFQPIEIYSFLLFLPFAEYQSSPHLRLSDIRPTLDPSQAELHVNRR